MVSKYTERLTKLEEMEVILNEIKKEQEHYTFLLSDKYAYKRKNILSSLIYGIESKDVFELAMNLKKMEITLFFETLKKELSKLDKNQDSIRDFDEEQSKIEIEETQKKRDFFKEEKEELMSKYRSYPIELIEIFNIIFKSKLVEDQSDVLDIKKSNWQYSFSKNKRTVYKAIKDYYELIDLEEDLRITDGTDLCFEYNSFKEIELNIDNKSKEIQRKEGHLKMLAQESYIFKKDLKELQRLNDFDKIKKKIIADFTEISENISNTNYYIEKITTINNDKETFREMYLLKLEEEFFNIYTEWFKEIEENIYKEIKFLEQELKYIAFCKMDKITYPYFSNIEYFSDRMLNYKKLKTEFFKFFSNKKIIESELFEDFNEKNKNIFKDESLEEFFTLKSDFKIFSESEKNFLSNETNEILARNSKEK